MRRATPASLLATNGTGTPDAPRAPVHTDKGADPCTRSKSSFSPTVSAVEPAVEAIRGGIEAFGKSDSELVIMPIDGFVRRTSA